MARSNRAQSRNRRSRSNQKRTAPPAAASVLAWHPLCVRYSTGVPLGLPDQILNVPSIPPSGHIGRRKGAARRRQSDNSTTKSAAEDRSGWNHRPSWVDFCRSALRRRDQKPDVRLVARFGRNRRSRYGVSDGDKQTFALGHCRRQPPPPWLTFTTGQPPVLALRGHPLKPPRSPALGSITYQAHVQRICGT
jgi:hypothetical protein